jgi:hypothetical protein
LTLEGEQAMCGSSAGMHGSIDFHSSNTWVGASTPYVKTNTSQPTGNRVVSGFEFVFAFMRYLCVESLNQQSVEYGSGSFRGKFFAGFSNRLELIDCRNYIGIEYIDQVTIGSGLVINNQSIGVASEVGYYSFYYP